MYVMSAMYVYKYVSMYACVHVCFLILSMFAVYVRFICVLMNVCMCVVYVPMCACYVRLCIHIFYVCMICAYVCSVW